MKRDKIIVGFNEWGMPAFNCRHRKAKLRDGIDPKLIRKGRGLCVSCRCKMIDKLEGISEEDLK